MRIGNVLFRSNVLCGPGARGFFGEGYPHHRPLRWLWGDIWRDTTFAAKTMTWRKRTGNLPLGADGLTMQELLPRAICVRPLSGHTLNAVSLSNPGAPFLYAQQRWQQQTEPFVLSWAAVGDTPAEREKEIVALTELTRRHQPSFRSPFATQLNCGCPNTGRPDELSVTEIGEWLQIAAPRVTSPLIVNVSVAIEIGRLLEIAALKGCDALWIANTVPWGDSRIDWQRLFGSQESPLTKRGFTEPGGLSGPACLPPAVKLVHQCREAGVTMPIIAGNGVLTVKDAQELIAAGATGVALGMIGTFYPWRVPAIAAALRKEPSP